MRRFLISCAVIALALLGQLTFINRLTLPGGAGPDLVLLAVVALALTGGPLAGALTGFLAGLALDVAPPASHTIGQYALVFCLVGYGCGRLAALGDASPGLYVGISAAAAAAGAALHAALGVLLSDPQVTWAAVRHVLPPSVVFDVILSPFVLYAVVRLNGWAGGAAREESVATAPAAAAWQGHAAGLAGLTVGAVRQASTSGTPRLNLADRRGGGSWIASARTASAARPAGGWRPGAERDLKLNFSGARGVTAGAAGGGGGAAGLAGTKSPKLRFTAGRRDSLAHRGTGAAPRVAVPRFRRRRITGTAGAVGTGGALGASTPRRRTFTRRRVFGGRSALGTRRPSAALSAGRGLRGRRATAGGIPPSRNPFRRSTFSRNSRGGGAARQPKTLRRGSLRASSGRTALGPRSFGRRPPSRLRMRRGSVRARVRRLFHSRGGGFR